MNYKPQLAELTDPTEEEREEILRSVNKLGKNKIDSESQWVTLFEYDEWDRKFYKDIKLGKMDRLIEKAKKDYEEGRTVPLDEFLDSC